MTAFQLFTINALPKLYGKVLETDLQIMRPDFIEWANEQTFFDPPTFVVTTQDFDYDTMYATYMVSVQYENEHDAFAHRMRW